jgi:protein CpxP
MNRFRVLSIATMMMFALTAPAQQGTTASGSTEPDQRAAQDGVPSAEVQLKFFTEKLELSSDQRDKMKPILEELHDATVKFVQDTNMSHAERMDNVRASRYKADKKIREILSDEQKTKLDQLEQEPHPELHGNVNG